MLCFTELLMEQKVYPCLLCWGTATASFTAPVGRKAVTAQGSADRAVFALEIPDLKFLLCSLHFLFWGGSSGSTGEELRSLQSPPSSPDFVLSISGVECPAGPHCGWLFPALFLWWAPCPESFYSSPRLPLPPFSDFRIPQCLYCAAHLPWPWLWWCARMHHQARLCVAFLLAAVCLKTPFFPPFPVFSVTPLLSAVPLRPLHQSGIGYCPVSRLVRICSLSSCRQELFSRQRRGTDTTILWTSCVISAQKSSSSSMCKVEGNCSSGGIWGALTLPGCCFGSSLQPTMDFKLLWPGSELLPYLTKGRVSHSWDMAVKWKFFGARIIIIVKTKPGLSLLFDK